MIKLYKPFLILLLLFGCHTLVIAQVDSQQKKVTINFAALENEPEQIEDIPENYRFKRKDFQIEVTEFKLSEAPNLLSPNANSGLNLQSNFSLDSFGKEKAKEINFKNEPKDGPKRALSDNERMLKFIEGGEYIPHFPDFVFGNFETDANKAIINFADDGRILDGDAIRIIVNDKIIENRIVLSRVLESYTIDLQPGFNKIEIEAVDEGKSNPMTMFLQVMDGNFKPLKEKSYPLSIGSVAKFIIVRK